jgi:hypothetical protein
MARKENGAAKLAILNAWDKWASDQGLVAGDISDAGGFRVFNLLNSRQSPLLDFRSRTQDKWQTVHGWLLSGRRVLE